MIVANRYINFMSSIKIFSVNFTKYIARLISFTIFLGLASCEPSISANRNTATAHNQPIEVEADTDFIMSVFGAIHGTHRNSDTYSLPVLEKAVRNFKPDVIFIEIPPSSMAQARSTFDQFGEVRERRTRAFPELTDVAFPLQKELGYTMVATAAWSRQLADKRLAALKQIEGNPGRRNEWNEHIAARRNLSLVQRGKNDDPFYIHTVQYDAEVKTAQTPYERYFDADLGAGGWGPINDAHIALMINALNNLKSEAQEKPVRVLVIFGAWHKYKILEAMEKRNDVTLVDARRFFAE